MGCRLAATVLTFEGFIRNSLHITICCTPQQKKCLTSRGIGHGIIMVCVVHNSFLSFSYTLPSVQVTHPDRNVFSDPSPPGLFSIIEMLLSFRLLSYARSCLCGREAVHKLNNTVTKLLFSARNVDELSGFLGPDYKVKTTAVAY